MIALRRGAIELIHEDYMEGKGTVLFDFAYFSVFLGILEVQAKKRTNLV